MQRSAPHQATPSASPDRSIWATSYDLDDAQSEGFRAWLHGEFFPKLLDKGKYAWTANYVRVDAPAE